jgi:hypothetical protein
MDISNELNDRIRFKNLAIEGLVKEYRGTNMKFISETDIRKIFNYLERYCEIVNGGPVPIRIYKSSAKCSVFWIKSKLMLFFLNYGRVFKGLKPLAIMEKLLGPEEYNSVLNSYFGELNDEHFTEPSEIKGTMEDVDGGGRTKRKRMRKTKRRAFKRKTKRRKSSRR